MKEKTVKQEKQARATSGSPVAIIGMGCLFPQAQELKEYWRLLFRGEDAIGEIPPTHWSPADYFDADPKRPDFTYCQRGGFLDSLSFDPSEFGIPPMALEATDTAQLLGLVAAKRALEDGGYGAGREFDRERVSVLLGVTGTLELVISLGARLGHPIWRRALQDAGIGEEQTEEIVARIADGYVPWQENSFPGLLGNVVAGRIANRLDFGGTNCVVDAACASSLSAMHLGLMELESGRADMVLSGGVDTLNDIFMYMCFSKTPALSATGDIRPFSAEADGTIIGEGIGVMLLKRLADAERDGDRIYAVIRGVGTSSDGRSQSIYAPRAAGQRKAILRAYERAGVPLASVGLIEAHGTGTKVGDAVEFASLRSVFDEAREERSWCALGTVKSQIGHTKSAAGAASAIKAALALYHKTLPPTLKVKEPNPKMELPQSAFYLNTETRPWLAGETPRRAGVSSFGFGGSNFHMVLEEYEPTKPEVAWTGATEIFACSANSSRALVEQVEAWLATWRAQGEAGRWAAQAYASRGSFATHHPYRLVVTWEKGTSLGETLEKALVHMRRAPKEAMMASDLMYSGFSVSSPGRVACVFPGQGSQYPGMGNALACVFPAFLEGFDEAQACFVGEQRLGALVYPPPVFDAEARKAQEAALAQTEVAQPALGAVSLAMWRILESFGVQADAFAGHSYGELVALCAAGWITPEALHALSNKRGQLMAGKPGERGTMLAVSAPLVEIQAMCDALEADVVLANRNSPRQAVLSGTAEAIAAARDACAARGFQSRELAVSAAFHSALVADACAPLGAFLETVAWTPTTRDVYANKTGQRYPEEPEAGKALLAAQLASPVDFVGEIEALYESGVRVFVIPGPKAVLRNLIDATLGERPHHCVALDPSKGRQGMLDLARTLGSLAVLGLPVALDAWEQAPAPEPKQRMSIPLVGANYRSTARKYGPDTPAKTKQAAKTPASAQQPKMALRATSAPKANGPQTTPSYQDTPNPSQTHAQGASLQHPPTTETSSVSRTSALSSSHALGGGGAALQSQPLHVPSDAQGAPFVFQPTGSQDLMFKPNAPEARQPHAPGFRNGTSKQSFVPPTQHTPEAAWQAPHPPAAQPHSPMQPSQTPHPTPTGAAPQMLLGALQVVQEGLRSMQALQQQTAWSHQRFLESQQVAQQSLQQMMSSSQRLVEGVLGLPQTPALPVAPMPTQHAPQQSAPVAMMPGFAPQTPAPVWPQAQHQGTVPPQSPMGGYAPQASQMPVQTSLAQGAAYAPTVLDASGPARQHTTVQQHFGASMAQATAAPQSSHGPVQAAWSTPAQTPAPASPQASRAAVKAPQAVQASVQGASIQTVILEVVAELTGYPVEMLSLEMDMEADLGIDSIKRVEILSTVSERLPEVSDVDPESMGSLRTLEQVVEALEGAQKATSAAPTPVAASAKPAAPVPVAVDVSAVLLGAVAELTGYPVEMLSLEMDMEADLGIDSIKRVEILSTVTEQVPAMGQVDTEALRNLRTLQEILDAVPAGQEEPADPFVQPPLPTREEGENQKVARRVVRRIFQEFSASAPLKLRKQGEIWLVGEDAAWMDALREAFAQEGFVVHHATAAQDWENAAIGALAGVVVLAGPGQDGQEPWGLQEEEALKQAFVAAKALIPGLMASCEAQEDAFFATLTRMDGTFGFLGQGGFSPLQGGLAGLSKTLSHEAPKLSCKAIDLAPAVGQEALGPWAAQVVQECLHRGPLEVGLGPEGRTVLSLQEVPLADVSEAEAKVAPLEAGDVVLVTGGARGVTADVVEAMAKAFAPTMVLLGRSPAPEEEPAWLAGLSTEAEIKKGLMLHGDKGEKLTSPVAIQRAYARHMKNREIRDNLRRIAQAGGRVVYRSVDVRDRDALAACFGEIREAFGPIRALMHGAGVLEDRLIVDKTPAQFAWVFDTKVQGLRALLDVTREDPLRCLILFSSVSGRCGNKGQVDYAMANEVLNKVAQTEAATRPDCRVLSANWGPWDGGMVTPSLKKVFVSQGVSLIPREAGAWALVRELQHQSNDVEVVFGDVFEGDGSPEQIAQNEPSSAQKDEARPNAARPNAARPNAARPNAAQATETSESKLTPKPALVRSGSGPRNGGPRESVRNESVHHKSPLAVADRGPGNKNDRKQSATPAGSHIRTGSAPHESARSAVESNGGSGGATPPAAGGKKMLPPAAGGKSSRLGRRQEKEAMESCFSFGLEEEAFGILADHKIGGRPVVPLALSMEWLGHGALHGNPGLKLLGYDDVRVLKALHLGDGPRQVQVVSAPVQRVGECFQQKLVLQSKDASGEVLRHVGGVALLGAKAPEIPELVKKPGGVVPRGIYLRSLEDAYTKVLFHGEGLWGLQEVRDFGEGGMEAVVSTAPPPAQWMAAPMRRRWVHDPLVLDCAFQMAILWCYETQGMVSLPSSVGRYRQLQRFPKGEVSLKLDVTKVSPHKMCGDFSVRDADGRLVARLMDYTCTMDASLWRAFHG